VSVSLIGRATFPPLILLLPQRGRRVFSKDGKEAKGLTEMDQTDRGLSLKKRSATAREDGSEPARISNGRSPSRREEETKRRGAWRIWSKSEEACEECRKRGDG